MTSDWIRVQGLSAALDGYCTTRSHGFSAPPYAGLNLGEHVGDDSHCVRQNRDFLTQHLPSAPIWVEQVHGTRVIDASAMPLVGDRRADALITDVPGQVLGILTADCMPVVLASDSGQVLGLAHAGWRGLAAGVLTTTVAAMRTKAGSLPTWRAWIGPCIGPQAFEVGSEVRDAFLQIDPKLVDCFTKLAAPHKWHCNMPAIAQKRLLELGAESVHWCGLCTVLDEHRRFFSYRRDGTTGRMATVAWLNQG
jgi:YfiH family protein